MNVWRAIPETPSDGLATSRRRFDYWADALGTVEMFTRPGVVYARHSRHVRWTESAFNALDGDADRKNRMAKGSRVVDWFELREENEGTT